MTARWLRWVTSKPKIFVDGDEMPAVGWGRTLVPARPGRHHVHVHVPRRFFWPRRMGPADTVVEVYPGRLVELEYKKPVWQYSPGSLGAAPQSYNGVGIWITVNLFFLGAFLSIMMVTHAWPPGFVAVVVVASVVNAVVLLVQSGSKPRQGRHPINKPPPRPVGTRIRAMRI